MILYNSNLVRTVFLAAALLCPRLSPADAADDGTGTIGLEDLADLSIESLMGMEVISVSRREESISRAASAIHVVTSEDIRRSDAANLPEALQDTPGLHVAQAVSFAWSVSARGFPDVFSEKLLVLNDGRSAYNPLFSGVFWDTTDVFMEDVDRIEVILGPGATMWGANAVNGVINIITKPAKETQGLLITGRGGSESYGGGLRYGGRLSENVHYRAYVKHDSYDDAVLLNGADAGDDWKKEQGGLRIDYVPNDSNTIEFIADIYDGTVNAPFAMPLNEPPYFALGVEESKISGANALVRWEHTISDTSDTRLQAYYTRTDRDDPRLDERRDIFATEFQHRFAAGDRHSLVWGLSYDYTQADMDSSFAVSLPKDRYSSDVFGAFLQDDIWIVEDALRFSIGSKFEQNDFSGFEIQPGVRLLWLPDERQTVWTSISRAVRTPNYSDEDVRLNLGWNDPDGPGGNPPFLNSVLPGDNLEAEDLLAFELGYRVRPLDRVYFDAAVFYNYYTDLITTIDVEPFPENEPPPSHVTTGSQYRNAMEGDAIGGELAVTWNVLDDWTLTSGYSLVSLRLDRADGQISELEDDQPRQQAFLRSRVNLPHRIEFDTTIRYFDTIYTTDTFSNSVKIPSYVGLDVRIGWRPVDNLQLSIGAKNLLDPEHPEFSDVLAPTHQVQRSFYVKATWEF